MYIYIYIYIYIYTHIYIYIYIYIYTVFSFKNCRFVFCAKIAQRGFCFFRAGQFRTRAHPEKWDMALDSKMPCLVLKSLDGHETGRQAKDLDENFGAPCSC